MAYYYPTYPQTYPSKPSYGTAPIYRPQGNCDASIVNSTAFGPTFVDTAFTNVMTDGMKNNRVWNQGAYSPFIPQTDFGNAAIDVQAQKPLMEDLQYFLPNGGFIASQPIIPSAATRHTNFGQWADITDALPAVAASGHLDATHHRLAPYPQRGPPTVDSLHPRAGRHTACADTIDVTERFPPLPSTTTPPDRHQPLANKIIEYWASVGVSFTAETVDASTSQASTCTTAPAPDLFLPQDSHRLWSPSTLSLSRGSSSRGPSEGGYQPNRPSPSSGWGAFQVQGRGGNVAHPGMHVVSPSLEGGADTQWPGDGEQGPPTMVNKSPTGYMSPAGLFKKPDDMAPTHFKATGPRTSSEDSSSSALSDTNNRSKTTFPRDGPLLELDAPGILSSAPSRLTIALPTPGSNSGRKRRAEENEQERGEVEERPKKKKRSQAGTPQQLKCSAPARTSTSKSHRYTCPVEDCRKSMSKPGGWTRHVFHTHYYEPNLTLRTKKKKALWVCVCGQCFLEKRTRDDHPRICGKVPDVPGWSWTEWDARIERIRRTRGAFKGCTRTSSACGRVEGVEDGARRQMDSASWFDTERRLTSFSFSFYTSRIFSSPWTLRPHVFASLIVPSIFVIDGREFSPYIHSVRMRMFFLPVSAKADEGAQLRREMVQAVILREQG